MDVTYHEVTHFAHTWGLVLLVILFVGSLAYALWPSNQKQFDEASRVPLDDDDDLPKENDRGD